MGESWGELPDKEERRQASQQRFATLETLKGFLWGLQEPWAGPQAGMRVTLVWLAVTHGAKGLFLS